MAVSFTPGGDFIVPSENGQTYLGGAGDDLYILSGATVRPNATIVIQDTQGTNNIQLIGGLSIASSLVTSNALELTLSNNAKVQILGANNFGYDVGGNIFVDVEGTQQDFEAFVTNTLGTTVPGPGEPFSTGGAVTIPVGGGVVDTTPPALVFSNPADDAIDVAVDADLVFTFSEDIQAGTGNISVFNAGGLVESVAVGNAVFDGETVTVDLVADLDPGTDYFVRIAATAILDLAGNAFAGITSPTVLNFTTAGAAGPDENVVDMAAGGSYNATDGVADVFQYEVDSTTGRAVGKDGEVSITGFNVAEDRLEFVDAGDNLTNANFETFPGVNLAENPFSDNTLIAFDPDAGVANVITLAGIQDAALDTIDYLVV